MFSWKGCAIQKQSPERNGQNVIAHKTEKDIKITCITKVQTPD